MSERGVGGRGRRALALTGVVALLSALAATTPGVAGAAAPKVPQIYTMHVHMIVDYRVVGRVTQVRGFQLSGLPPAWYATVRCLGHGCFSPGLHHPWPKDVRILRTHRFYPGQRLVFIFNRPYFKTVTFVLKMRDNIDPKLSLYKPHPKHKRKGKRS